jgi:hypothetical protein
MLIQAPRKEKGGPWPPQSVKKKLFFLEEKSQKTFAHMAYASRQVRDSTTKSLFASFSSEKEESFS